MLANCPGAKNLYQGTEQQPHASKSHTLARTYTLRTRTISGDETIDDRSEFQSRSQNGSSRTTPAQNHGQSIPQTASIPPSGTPGHDSRKTNSLVTYITPHDPLPLGWYPKRIRKQSADDTHHLREFWERKYGITTPVDRRKSEPAGYKFHDSDVIQPKRWHKFIIDRFSAWLGSLRPKRPDLQAITQFLPASQNNNIETSGSQQTVVDTSLQPTQFGPDLIRPTRQVRLGSSITHGNRHVGSARGLDGLYQSCFEFGQGVLSGIDVWLRLFWWFFQRPIYLVLSLLCFIEIIALSYTVTSNAFLNTFCEMKLPGLRDWVCSDWDTDRVRRLHTQAATDINGGLGDMFEDENLGTTISLPYYLSNWQSEYRYLRSHLKSAKLPAAEEEYFYNKLTASIDLSKDAIGHSQSTFSHLHGTVNHIVDGTRILVGSLNETGFTSAISLPDVPGNSLMATGMQWLETHNLVYLPLGIEPFQESTDTLAQNGIMRMRIFVHATRRRLMADRMGLIALQDQMRTLAEIADELDTATADATDQEATIRVFRGHRRWYGFLKMIGEPNLDDWITEQRLQALESMAPAYQGHIDYLKDAILQLGSALQACDSLEENLLGEESAVRRGMRPSDWVVEQPRVLEKGAATLAQELKAWDMKKKGFNERVFSQLR